MEDETIMAPFEDRTLVVPCGTYVIVVPVEEPENVPVEIDITYRGPSWF